MVLAWARPTIFLFPWLFSSIFQFIVCILGIVSFVSICIFALLYWQPWLLLVGFFFTIMMLGSHPTPMPLVMKQCKCQPHSAWTHWHCFLWCSLHYHLVEHCLCWFVKGNGQDAWMDRIFHHLIVWKIGAGGGGFSMSRHNIQRNDKSLIMNVSSNLGLIAGSSWWKRYLCSW